MTLGTVFLVVFYVLTGAASLAISYILWFILLPMQFRQLRDQFRRIRNRNETH